jgi:hypothetical protein
MTDERDDKIADYLWDPTSPADPGVEAIEARLLPLRFEPGTRPLVLPRPAQPVGGTHRVRWVLAAAALLVAASAGWVQWRFTWPAGRGWEISTPVSSRLSRLEVGATFELPAADPAVAPTVINVARIGTMTVAGGSRVTLQSTHGTRHRLQMDLGEAHFRVWAPPRSVAIQTPVGEVIDFGCEFDLRVEQDMTSIDVRSGWVQLDNTVGEVLVPEGAASEMRRGVRPGVPVFNSATAAFRTAVRELEQSGLERSGDDVSIRTVVQDARVEDMLTLLLLVERHSAGADRIAARAAELSPPPRDVTVGQVLRGDRDGLWRWRDTLPLPPPKGWLRNWQDALPQWLRK